MAQVGGDFNQMRSADPFEAGKGGIGVLEAPVRPHRHHGGELPPPDDGDDEGGGGGGGWGGGDGDGDPDDGVGPRSRPRGLPVETTDLGMALALVGIGTLFVTVLGAWVLARRQADAWPPPGTPDAPDGLLLSTGALVLVSLCLQGASRARSTSGPAARWLALAGGLGVAFLALQAWVWRDLLAAELGAGNPWGGLFYTLTGMHALHVVGGLVFLVAALLRARRGPLPGRRTAVERCGLYWHFLLLLWAGLFAALYVADGGGG